MEEKKTNPYYRIEAILALFDITAYALAKQIGLNRPDSLYNIRDGRIKNITGELALKIQSVYTSLNLNWILTGEGKMIDINHDDNDEVSKSKEKAIIQMNKKLVELMRRVQELEKIIKNTK